MQKELNELNETQAGTLKTEEQSVISRHLGRLEEQVRLLHDRLTPVLGSNTSVETSDDRKETSPLCEKIILIEEIIEAIHNRLEV